MSTNLPNLKQIGGGHRKNGHKFVDLMWNDPFVFILAIDLRCCIYNFVCLVYYDIHTYMHQFQLKHGHSTFKMFTMCGIYWVSEQLANDRISCYFEIVVSLRVIRHECSV